MSALLFNPIDTVNFPQMGNFTLVNAQQTNLIAKIGGTIYVRLMVTNAPPGLFQQPIIYKSPNGGVSWSIEDVTYPGTFFFAYAFGDLIADGGTLRTIENQSNASIPNIGLNVYTPGSGWGTIENIGGGFPANYYPTSPADQALSVRQFVRSGSRVIVYSVRNGNGDLGISVLQIVGGTTTQIVQLDDIWDGSNNTDYTLDTVHQIGDVLHIFFARRHFTGGGGAGTSDRCHISISAANVVGTLQILEANMENHNSPTTSRGRADSSADGNTIAFTYGSHVHTSPGPPGYMQAAIGDMSMDPLNPTWTIETIPGSSVFPPFNVIPAGVSFRGGNTLSAYWFDGQWNAGSGWALTSATRLSVGSWSSLNILYGPTVANYAGAGALMAFDLLNSLPTGVGILLQIGDATGLAPVVGYNGPTLGGRFTFASNGKSQHSRSAKIS